MEHRGHAAYGPQYPHHPRLVTVPPNLAQHAEAQHAGAQHAGAPLAQHLTTHFGSADLRLQQIQAAAAERAQRDQQRDAVTAPYRTDSACREEQRRVYQLQSQFDREWHQNELLSASGNSNASVVPGETIRRPVVPGETIRRPPDAESAADSAASAAGSEAGNGAERVASERLARWRACRVNMGPIEAAWRAEGQLLEGPEGQLLEGPEGQLLDARQCHPPTQRDVVHSPMRRDMVHSPIHSSIRSDMVHSPIHSSIRSDMVHSPIHSSIRSDMVHSPIHSPMRSGMVHSPMQSDMVHSPMQSDMVHSALLMQVSGAPARSLPGSPIGSPPAYNAHEHVEVPQALPPLHSICHHRAV